MKVETVRMCPIGQSVVAIRLRVSNSNLLVKTKNEYDCPLTSPVFQNLFYYTTMFVVLQSARKLNTASADQHLFRTERRGFAGV
jgi:hypothetical protein